MLSWILACVYTHTHIYIHTYTCVCVRVWNVCAYSWGWVTSSSPVTWAGCCTVERLVMLPDSPQWRPRPRQTIPCHSTDSFIVLASDISNSSVICTSCLLRHLQTNYMLTCALFFPPELAHDTWLAAGGFAKPDMRARAKQRSSCLGNERRPFNQCSFQFSIHVCNLCAHTHVHPHV